MPQACFALLIACSPLGGHGFYLIPDFSDPGERLILLGVDEYDFLGEYRPGDNWGVLLRTFPGTALLLIQALDLHLIGTVFN